MTNTTPDPEAIERIQAQGAHHEAGHAVAVVAAGGEVVFVRLADDWHAPETIDWDTPAGLTRSRQSDHMVPFTTFAGPWAEATWMVENDPDIDDFYEAIDYAWSNSGDGDAAMYQACVEALTDAAQEMGFPLVGNAWENDWNNELTAMWPAICEVAAVLIDGQPVTHDTVHAAIERCRAAAALDDTED